MKEYFEAHITMEFPFTQTELHARLVEEVKWKFSCIAGDIDLGPGIKGYATTQYNLKIGKEAAVQKLNEAAEFLEGRGVKVIRRKIEQVLYDDRQGKCEGACIECVGLDAETFDRAAQFWKNCPPDDARQRLVDMGIHNPDGTLTENYK